jgi:hypothetical protein
MDDILLTLHFKNVNNSLLFFLCNYVPIRHICTKIKYKYKQFLIFLYFNFLKTVCFIVWYWSAKVQHFKYLWVILYECKAISLNKQKLRFCVSFLVTGTINIAIEMINNGVTLLSDIWPIEVKVTGHIYYTAQKKQTSACVFDSPNLASISTIVTHNDAKEHITTIKMQSLS